MEVSDRWSSTSFGFRFYEEKSLEGGKVTIAGINFLRHTHFRNVIHYRGSHPGFRGKEVPPNAHVSLWT